ncbi:hypothetical protein BKA70DRAFT_1345107 [Coprinopsis sp. MPI-PUGE-AT-0042]|nr:hypothetical protein BKA70DRAFT_1345107 [Coprinopsis sp. MPI-PUGE-AT-0042]
MSCKVLVKIGAHVATGILSVSALVMESVIGHVRLFHKASYVISSFFTCGNASAWKREDTRTSDAREKCGHSQKIASRTSLSRVMIMVVNRGVWHVLV